MTLWIRQQCVDRYISDSFGGNTEFNMMQHHFGCDVANFGFDACLQPISSFNTQKVVKLSRILIVATCLTQINDNVGRNI